MSDKLKSCPFCGGEARIDFTQQGKCIIYCDNCMAEMRSRSTYVGMIIKAWNRRVNETIINNGEITINL